MTFFNPLFISSRPHSLPGLLSVPSSGCSASLSRLVSLQPLRLPCATSGLLLAFAAPLFAAASTAAEQVQPPLRQKTISRPADASLDPSVKASTLALSSASSSATLGKNMKQGASTASHAPLLLTILEENTPATEPATHTAANAVSSAVSSQARFDFGSVSSLSPAQHVQTFLLRNDNKVPVTVSQLQASSGCLQAVFAAIETPSVSSAATTTSGLAQRTALHQLLPPGQQIPLHVTLNSIAMPPGAVDQSLWVFVEGQASPAATLKITGSLQPLLQFSPRVLDFGTVSGADKNALNKHFLSLTMTLDPQLAAGGLRPQITCSDPDIKIEPVTDATAEIANATAEAAAPAGSATPAGAGSRLPATHPVVQTYRVKLSSLATPGSLKSRLIFSFASPAVSAVADSQTTSSLQVTASPPAFPKGASQNAILVIIPVTGEIVADAITK